MSLLDIILIGIMLISGLLAMMRGLTRELLTLAAWGGAALATYFAIRQQKLIDLVLPYVDKPMIAQVIVGVVAFLLTLIIISLVSIKLSDAVVDSAVGAIDRSLGLVFGLARGFILVAIAYLFYGWLLPDNKQDAWVKNAKSLTTIKAAGDYLVGFMPPDIADTLRNTALMRNPETAPIMGDQNNNPDVNSPDAKLQDNQGYQPNDTQRMNNLVEGAEKPAQTQNQPAPQPNTQQPTFGQGTAQ